MPPRIQKLGQILLRAGVVDQLQLSSALGQVEQWGSRLGKALAMADPTDLETVDMVAARSRCRVKPFVAGEGVIQRAIRRHYHGVEVELEPAQEPPSLSEVEEFKLVDRAGKTLTPGAGAEVLQELRAKMGGATPGAAPPLPPPPLGSVEQQLSALRTSVDNTQKALRALVDVLVRKQLVKGEELLEAKKRAGG
ncbi:MAG: hypothetical protein HYZ28_05955 [Myxococcales bacterium]|nr:hypothetical protein [Myxococcales bacterium]